MYNQKTQLIFGLIFVKIYKHFYYNKIFVPKLATCLVCVWCVKNVSMIWLNNPTCLVQECQTNRVWMYMTIE